MEITNNSVARQNKKMKIMTIILIIESVLLAGMIVVCVALSMFNDFKASLNSLYDPENGPITVVNSPDKKAQIIIREGHYLQNNETRFYYKKVNSSKEYKIGETSLEFGDTIYEGHEYKVTWSKNNVKIEVKLSGTERWETFVFEFPN